MTDGPDDQAAFCASAMSAKWAELNVPLAPDACKWAHLHLCRRL